MPERLGVRPEGQVALGKLAVDAGLVVLYEIEAGEFRLTGRSKSLAKAGLQATVADYVATQGRFRGISEQTWPPSREWAEERWERFQERDAS